MAFVFGVVGCMAISAYLVVQGHPWFALLIIAVGALGKWTIHEGDNHDNH